MRKRTCRRGLHDALLLEQGIQLIESYAEQEGVLFEPRHMRKTVPEISLTDAGGTICAEDATRSDAMGRAATASV